MKQKNLCTQCEEPLIPLHNINVQLLRDKKTYQQTLATEQVHHNESCLKLKEMQSEIKKLEVETSEFVKNCQEIYDSEISKALPGYNDPMDSVINKSSINRNQFCE